MSSGRADRAFDKLAASAGCSVRTTDESGSGEHLAPGETTEYDTSPPTHGAHAPSTLPAGVYDEPLSDNPAETRTIFRAVHSLEHGAVIIWHDKLADDDIDDLDREFGTEKKVLIAPYPPLKGDKVALSAWGRLATCERADNAFIEAFIERYREARTAPEATVPI